MKNIFLALLATTLLFSCRPKEIELKIDKFSTKMVVNSQVIPSKFLIVSLTKSFSLLSDGYSTGNDTSNVAISKELANKLLINDATVTVNHSGITDTLTMLSPGIYISYNTTQNSGEYYTLHAIDKENNLEITATEKMASIVKFEDASFAYENNTLTFKYKFTDPLERNYYSITIYHKSYDGGATKYTKPTVGDFINNGNKYSDGYPFTDGEFNGETVNGAIAIPNYQFSSAQDTMLVSLSSISEGYYNYLALRKKVDNNVLSQVFNEPVNYPSNVQGGLGYFSTNFSDIKTLILPAKTN